MTRRTVNLTCAVAGSVGAACLMIAFVYPWIELNLSLREALHAQAASAECVRHAGAPEVNDNSKYAASVILEASVNELKPLIISRVSELCGINEGSTASMRITASTMRAREGFRGSPQIAAADSITTGIMIALEWYPPAQFRQSIAEGGGWVPFPSTLEIRIVSLIGQPSCSVVDIRRAWRYKVWTHFPFTNIPFRRVISERLRVLPEDLWWLETITQEQAVSSVLLNQTYSDPALLETLKRCASDGDVRNHGQRKAN